MPPMEAMDPALVLDEWTNRAQNLPEEIKFMLDEIADKDKQYDRLIREIEDRDNRLQKYIKLHGSHAENPKEAEWRATIERNYEAAKRLGDEKETLARKMQVTMDKHVRHLDMQIKHLYDRNEPGFSDPDELPSLIRPSAANIPDQPALTSASTALSTTATASGVPSQISTRPALSQLKTNNQHAASAPTTPGAGMMLSGRQARENSTGPGSGAPKRGPRSITGLGNLPTMSSGLARHSSLGPGTPKGQHHTATGTQRAGSAGPRANTKGVPGGPARKGTPSSSIGGRKKSMPAAGAGSSFSSSKSGLSRVKRTAKNSPSSPQDSELSDAEDLSGEDSDARTGGRGTPAARSSSHPGNGGASHKDGSHDREAASGPSSGPRKVGPGKRGPRAEDSDDDEDGMDLDEDEAGDDRKYCLCQNVSFGDMVACDNDNCPFEWFHWSCVGLKSEPNGTWYCPMCSEEKKKKAGLK